MFEKATTSFIISGSSLLLAYWFRYVCLLVLTAKPPRDYGVLAASANQLSFPTVQGMLCRASAADLVLLGKMLDRDYQVLSYLLKHIASPPAGMAAIETRMLAIDYQLMRWWFRTTSRSSPTIALGALNEMLHIVAHFANAMGERMGNAVAQ
jgi:hypothetical protein